MITQEEYLRILTLYYKVTNTVNRYLNEINLSDRHLKELGYKKMKRSEICMMSIIAEEGDFALYKIGSHKYLFGGAIVVNSKNFKISINHKKHLKILKKLHVPFTQFNAPLIPFEY